MTRSLFIYFRVARESEAAAVHAVRELQQAWQATMPGLRCDVLRRADEDGDVVTLMETYSGGINTAWQEHIERDAGERLAPLLIGKRHVEVFTPCA